MFHFLWNMSEIFAVKKYFLSVPCIDHGTNP